MLLPGVCRDGDPASGWFGEESIAVFGVTRDAICELRNRYLQKCQWCGLVRTPCPNWYAFVSSLPRLALLCPGKHLLTGVDCCVQLS